MPITESQILVLSFYTLWFACIVVFFELRLNYIHKRHIEKLWPIWEEGLQIIDRRLKIIVRVLFFVLFALSVTMILTLL